MSRKTAILFSIPFVIMELVLYTNGVPLFITLAVTLALALFSGVIVVLILNKRLSDILDEKCDPERFIAECEKRKAYSKGKRYQNRLNISISAGLDSSGRSQDALNHLRNNIDLDLGIDKLTEAVYHYNTFCFYVSMNDMDSASREYERYLKDFRKKYAYNQKVACSFDSVFMLYQYKLNKSPETARTYLAQLELLYNTYSAKISRRIRLNLRYNEAVVLHELGDYANAAKKYKTVAEKGNGLWIAASSREKLAEIGALREHRSPTK